MKKQKENSREGITWSEMGKQNVQAEKVYSKWHKPYPCVKILRAFCCKDRLRSARQKKPIFSQFARMKAEVNQFQKKKSRIVQVFISFFLEFFIICAWQQHKLKVKVLQNLILLHRKQSSNDYPGSQNILFPWVINGV